MADIATLGIEVNSGQVQKGARALDNMSGAAKRAEAAVNGFSSTSTGAASAASQMAAGIGKAEVGLERMAGAAKHAQQGLRMANAAANDNLKAASKFNVSNIAAQFQDVAVSAQMGMGALQIGLQQGTQLAAVLSTMENPLRGLGSALLSVVSPVSLLTIGLTALAAAGLQMVDWPKRAAQALVLLADNLKAIAPYATAAAAAIALLYAPQIISGIVSLITLLGRLTVAAATAALTLAATNPGIAFVLGITAAVAAANIFRDDLQKIFGVDIVGSAKDGANQIISILVGAYRAIVAAWEALPGDFARIGTLAGNALLDALGGINIKWKNPITGSETELLNLDFSSFKQKVDAVSAGAETLVKAAYDSAQGVDYVGKAYNAIESGASAASAKLKDLAKSMTAVDDEEKKAKTRHGKTDAEKYTDITKGADRRIATLLMEQQTIGMTEESAAALRYEQELLNDAQQKGIELTPQQANYFKLLAGTMAGLEGAVKKAREALAFAKDATKGFLTDFRQGLMNGEGVWKSFGNAAMNVLDKIIAKIEDQLIDAIFSMNNALGKSGGGVLGWLGGLFGGGGGSQMSIAMGGGIGLYAAGGVSNKPAIFGEAGPEAAVPLPDGRHIPVKILNAANNNASTPPQDSRSVVELRLSPDVEARILAQSGEQSVQLIHENNRQRNEFYLAGGNPR